MSKFHGEQHWTTVRHQTLHDWRELSEDDFDALRALRHDREIRQRSLRHRMRRDHQVRADEAEL